MKHNSWVEEASMSSWYGQHTAVKVTKLFTHSHSNKPVITLVCGKDLPHQAREGQLGDEGTPRPLVVTDLLQGPHSWMESVLANGGVFQFATLYRKLGVSRYLGAYNKQGLNGDKYHIFQDPHPMKWKLSYRGSKFYGRNCQLCI